MSTYFAVLTQVGEAKLANAIALGQTLKLKKMGVGDGNGALPIPDRLQKALVREVRRADLNQLAIDPANASQIIVEQVLPENVGGWWIREIGIYDEAGDLCAVANCPPSYKPVMAEGSARTQVVRVVLIVASTAAIELKIDPSVILATRKYADDQIIEVRAYADTLLAQHLAASDPHPQYRPKELIVLNKSVAGKVDVVLTEAEAQADVLNFTGLLTGSVNVIVPATARSWTVRNKTTGAYALTFKTAAGSGLAIGQGQTRVPYCDGVDVLSRMTESDTPPQFDASAKVANMQAVQRALGNFQGQSSIAVSRSLLASEAGCIINASATLTLTMPPSAPLRAGTFYQINNSGNGVVTLQAAPGDLLYGVGNGTARTFSLGAGDTLGVAYVGGGQWYAWGGVQAGASASFASKMDDAGYQKLPSGLVLQWGFVNGLSGASHVNVDINFPVSFSERLFQIVGSTSVVYADLNAAYRQDQTTVIFGGLGGTAYRSGITASLQYINAQADARRLNWIAIGK